MKKNIIKLLLTLLVMLLFSEAIVSCNQGLTIDSLFFKKTVTSESDSGSGDSSCEVVVSYNANGGDGEMEDQTFKKNVSQTLNPNAFERMGFSFLGWAESEDSDEVDYEDEESVSFNKNTTLYAVWKEASYYQKGVQYIKNWVGIELPESSETFPDIDGDDNSSSWAMDAENGIDFYLTRNLGSGYVAAVTTAMEQFGYSYNDMYNKEVVNYSGSTPYPVRTVRWLYLNVKTSGTSDSKLCRIFLERKGGDAAITEARLKITFHDTMVGVKGLRDGYIFYDCDEDNESGNADGLLSSECNWRYLEAAPEDLGETCMWGDYGSFGTEDGIGSGINNTAIIKSSASDVTTDNAAVKADNYRSENYYSLGGYYLPGKDELNLMYRNLKEKGLGDFSDESYWSSTESSASTMEAFVQNFSNGETREEDRMTYFKVRPVRSYKFIH